MENTFIISWCEDQLEWVVDVTGYDKQHMWSVLKGNDPISLIDSFKGAIIHKKAYPSKQFEVYAITVEDGTTGKEIREMFLADPKSSAEIIRNRGRRLHRQKEAL